MMTHLPETYKVLLADDSQVDRFMLKQVLNRFRRFRVVGETTDGEDTVDYFCARGRFTARSRNPLPDLLLLDLDMPRLTGFEVMQWLQNQWLPRLTIIVLSNSKQPEDVRASLAMGAKGFWLKQAGAKRQQSIANEMEYLLDSRWESWGYLPLPYEPPARAGA